MVERPKPDLHFVVHVLMEIFSQTTSCMLKNAKATASGLARLFLYWSWMAEALDTTPGSATAVDIKGTSITRFH